MTKRFTIEQSNKSLIIYDHNSIDDYYHVGNDERDILRLCDLLNELVTEINQLKEENKQLRNDYSNCEKFRYRIFKSIDDAIEDEKCCNECGGEIITLELNRLPNGTYEETRKCLHCKTTWKR